MTNSNSAPIRLAALFAFLLFSGPLLAATISGAGATFPATLYKKWAASYEGDGGATLQYQDTGSGDGIERVKVRAVDFGASDVPLAADELDKAGLLQFPVAAGGVVPVINVVGIQNGQLKLSGPLLADIFLGRIAKWNDPAIAALNPELALPNQPINVIHRAETSGTTYIFTNYLSKVSPAWKAAVGEGALVAWKVGTGCRTNLLIPVCLYEVNNSISYMDYAAAAKQHMNMVHLQNRAGAFVAPGVGSFQAAAHVAWQPGHESRETLTDRLGENSWPIVGATFILILKVQEHPASGREVLKFFDWAFSHGGAEAQELGYVPLPKAQQDQIRQGWATLRDAKGNAL